MRTIEKKFEQFPDLKEKLEALSLGHLTFKKQLEAKAYGYADEAAQTADEKFCAESLEWMLARWEKQPLPEGQQMSMAQILALDKKQTLDKSRGLLVPDENGTAPLARLIARLNTKTALTVSSLAIAAMAAQENAVFPDGFRFPASAESVKENLRKIALAFHVFGEESEDFGPVFKRAIEILRERRASFWMQGNPEKAAQPIPLNFEEDHAGGCVVTVNAYLQKQALLTMLSSVKKRKEGVPFAEAPQESVDIYLGPRGKRGNSSVMVIPFDELSASKDFSSYFDALIGAQEAKDQVKSYISGRILSTTVQSLGIKGVASFPHMIFTGRTGVGKTSFAEALARALCVSGSLKSQAPIGLLNCSVLTDEASGATAKIVQGAMEEYEGGVLILDKADALLDARTYGKSAANALIGSLATSVAPPVLIATLAPRNLDAFYELDEGLRSKMPNLIKLEPYGHETLMKILKGKLEQDGLSTKPGVFDRASDYLFHQRKAEGSAFPNVWAVDHFIGLLWQNLAKRMGQVYPDLLSLSLEQRRHKIMQDSSLRAQLTTFEAQDVPVYVSSWQKAMTTKDDPVPELALVPRGEAARGRLLDLNPFLAAKRKGPSV